MDIEDLLQQGVLHQRAGRLREAQSAYQTVLKASPDHPNALHLLGLIAHQCGYPEASARLIERAIKSCPHAVALYINCGAAHFSAQDIPNATARFRQAIQLDPSNALAYSNLGAALNAAGEFEEATAAYRAAISYNPALAEAHYGLSGLTQYGERDAHVQQMEALKCQSDRDRSYINFALGKAYEDIGDIAKSFAFYSAGNAAQRGGYDPSQDAALFEAVKQQEYRALPHREGKKPIFIVGMPRSGTSLVEQILASHPQVYGAGELEAIRRLCLAGTPMDALQSEYLQRLPQTDKPYITDKMPINFLWVGFILSAFPDAKIINVVRSPMATGWSIFKHRFDGAALGFTCSLADIGAFHGRYLDLMAHWHARFPGAIYDLNYEALTEQQEFETRRLLAYCGLDWDGACLRFHTTARTVKTASAKQVRKPMQRGTSETWRKFAAHLQPLKAALEIDRRTVAPQ